MKAGLFARVLAVPLALALPALFWLCHMQGWPLWLGGVLLLPLALLQGGRRAWTAAVVAAVLGGWALLARSDLPVRLYPVAINAALLAAFAFTLLRPPSMIERFVRLRVQMTPAIAAYCRRVTQAWCLFFIGNGGIALWTVLRGDEGLWALYNGGIAYLLMGLMFAGEWLVRRRVQRRLAEQDGEARA